jgi:hypothetical protein
MAAADWQEEVKMIRSNLLVKLMVSLTIGLSLQGTAQAGEMPITLKTFVTMDVKEVYRMIEKYVNGHEEDDEIYYNELAETLAFRILPHPSFAVRSAAINRLALKISESNEWMDVYHKAARKLIAVFNNANNPADKATALAGLLNLVTELRPKKETYRDLLTEIKDAHMTVPQDAADYAKDPMRHLISPSDEAALALN